MKAAKSGRTKPKLPLAGAKLPSGTTARAVKEWIGKTPDERPPARVQLRILERQHGKCAITGHKFRVGDEKRLDHNLAQADGGENRESNLLWILDARHKAKTKDEAAVRKVVRRKAKAHQGLKAPPKRPLESRNDLATAKLAEARPTPRSASMPTEMQRRYGIADKPPRGR